MDNNSLTYIVWNNEFSVHHSLLDNQHKKIIHLINETFRISQTDDYVTDDLEPIIKDILRYTKLHFATEERLLKKAGFENLEAHQAFHTKMSSNTKEISHLFLVRLLSVNELLTFLKEWWTQHILTEDQKYVSSFKVNN